MSKTDTEYDKTHHPDDEKALDALRFKYLQAMKFESENKIGRAHV